MFCRELAAQVRGVSDRIESKGAGVVFIGNGNATMAAAFKEDFDVRLPLYTDPSLEVYKAAQMHRGMGGIWKSIGYAPRALFSGHFQGRTQGDAMQQGGVLVVDPNGGVRYRFVSDAPGQHANLEEVIGALPARDCG